MMPMRFSSDLRAALAMALLVAAAGCGRPAEANPGPLVVHASGEVGNPTAASDPASGTSYVAWIETRDSMSDVYLGRTGADGRPLGEPVRVNDVPGDADPHDQAPAQVRVGPDGEVYVVWQKKVAVAWLPFGASDIRFARSLDGGQTFEPAITVTAEGDGPPARQTFHDLAVAPDGTIYVSWIDASRRDAARAAAYHAAGGKVEQGHKHGVPGEPGTEIRVARSDDGGRTFAASVLVDEESCPCCRTAIAAGADGAVYVVWRKVFPGNVRDIAIARSVDGGRTFSPAVAVHQDGWEFPGCPHAGPSVGVDADGRVHVAWYTGRDGRQGLYYAAAGDGVSFGAPVPLLTGEWVPPSQAQIAVAGRDVWVAWEDRREQEAQVFAARVTRGEIERRSAVRVTVPGASPALALGAPNGVLAWRADEAVRSRTLGGSR